jgi:hypothetical protein
MCSNQTFKNLPYTGTSEQCSPDCGRRCQRDLCAAKWRKRGRESHRTQRGHD